MMTLALEGCRAWYHPGRTRSAVVLCGALGFEELCARHSYRVLAELLVERGVGVLRFDYYGTGDSAGDLGAPDLTHRWLADIERAAHWLQERAGARDLTFVGFRLGALLATHAAATRGGIARLALLAPPVSGRTYGRELQMASQVMVPVGSEPGVRHNDGPGIDVAGFVFPPDLARSWRTLEPSALPSQPARKVLIASADGGGATLATTLQSAGATVTTIPFDDLARMMINPTSGYPCVATMRRVADWISEEASGDASSVAPPCDETIRGRGWIETARIFPADSYRCGILCEPVAAPADAVCALLLNGGRDSHVGWARGTVELARQLAAAGTPSFRFDLTRMADSQPDASGRRANLYDRRGPSGDADVQAAIDALQARGYRRFAIFGSCSGAHLALRVGLDDPRICAIAVRNIQRLVWGLDDRLLFPVQERIESSLGGRHHRDVDPRPHGARSAAGITRYLSRAGFRLGQSAIVASARAVSRLMRDRERLRGAIARFNARGGRLLMVYSANDPGVPHLDRMLGPNGAAILSEANRVHIVPEADHNFSSAALRAWFTVQMLDVIESASTASDAGPGSSSRAPGRTASLEPRSSAHR